MNSDQVRIDQTWVPPTSHLPHPVLRAGNGTRTRDPNLGKVVLYQLSYSRTTSNQQTTSNQRGFGRVQRENVPDGGEGNRTPDLLNAIQALSQLSYAPGPRKGHLSGTEKSTPG